MSDNNIYFDIRRFEAGPVLCNSANSGHFNTAKVILEKYNCVHYHNDLAIQLSAQCNHFDIFNFLLLNGANIHANNDYVLRILLKNRRTDIIKDIVSKSTNHIAILIHCLLASDCSKNSNLASDCWVIIKLILENYPLSDSDIRVYKSHMPHIHLNRSLQDYVSHILVKRVGLALHDYVSATHISHMNQILQDFILDQGYFFSCNDMAISNITKLLPHLLPIRENHLKNMTKHLYKLLIHHQYKPSGVFYCKTKNHFENLLSNLLK